MKTETKTDEPGILAQLATLGGVLALAQIIPVFGVLLAGFGIFSLLGDVFGPKKDKHETERTAQPQPARRMVG
ncbi:MAG: hypothetical protein GY764_09975 [Halieaceae bacterium]|nr:hypothetical protein [Halieaceae bacterium]